MSYKINTTNLDDLASSWNGLQHLRWNCLFTLPFWLRTWWQDFGAGAEPHILTVQEDKNVIGIAPLLIEDGVARFMGSPDVCDYLDFVVTPKRDKDFFNVLLDELGQRSIRCLDLHCLRPDSTVIQELIPAARERGHRVSIEQEAVSMEIELPQSWKDYLAMLNSKQRHELKRKWRRLLESGELDYRILDYGKATEGVIDHFLEMFRNSREDKWGFMTDRMEIFFRRMTWNMAAAGLLKVGVLELDGKDVAMVMYFNYRGAVYLYNNSYDSNYSSLNVGLLSKMYCLKDSIMKEKRMFDFMKGSDIYKYRLGGKEVPISHCQIELG